MSSRLLYYFAFKRFGEEGFYQITDLGKGK